MARNRRQPRPALAVGVAIVLYLPAVHAQYLTTWDDSLIVLGRPELRSLDGASIRAIFRPGSFEEFLPIRDLSCLAELLVPFDRAQVSHALNLVLMALATLGVAVLGSRLGVSPAASGWAALWFAVHPVHVEAVAPAALRKRCCRRCWCSPPRSSRFATGANAHPSGGSRRSFSSPRRSRRPPRSRCRS